MKKDDNVTTTKTDRKVTPFAIIVDYIDTTVSKEISEDYLSFINDNLNDNENGDLCVISYIGVTTIVQGWMHANEMKRLIALYGRTNILKVSATAVEKIEEQMNYYNNLGIETTDPFILIISDRNDQETNRYKEEINKRIGNMEKSPRVVYMNK